MQYEVAKRELQSPPKHVPFYGIAIEALALGLIATAMVLFV